MPKPITISMAILILQPTSIPHPIPILEPILILDPIPISEPIPIPESITESIPDLLFGFDSRNFWS